MTAIVFLILIRVVSTRNRRTFNNREYNYSYQPESDKESIFDKLKDVLLKAIPFNNNEDAEEKIKSLNDPNVINVPY